MHTDFSNLSLKFKVVQACIKDQPLKVTNVDLTNIIDTLSLIECVSGKWQAEREFNTLNAFNLRDPIKNMFTYPQPSTMYFVDGNSDVVDAFKPIMAMTTNKNTKNTLVRMNKNGYKIKQNNRVDFFYKFNKSIKNNWNRE